MWPRKSTIQNESEEGQAYKVLSEKFSSLN